MHVQSAIVFGRGIVAGWAGCLSLREEWTNSVRPRVIPFALLSALGRAEADHSDRIESRVAWNSSAHPPNGRSMTIGDGQAAKNR